MKTICPQCQSKKQYHLKDGRVRCATCKHRYSPAKQRRSQHLIEGFLDELTPKECAQKYGQSFPTVFERYTLFRQVITLYLEHIYQYKGATFSEYEEYLFLPRSKRENPKFFLEGISIMGMNQDNYVYTLLMPDHFYQYQHHYEKDALKEVASAELSSYRHWHKISKLKTFDTPLTKFWHFLESFMGRFHGVKRVYFTDYLKEAEFRFNFSKNEQKIILTELWKRVEANPKKSQLPLLNITK